MISSEIKKEIETACERISNQYDLSHVYFSQVFGKRRHHLGGFGEETYTGSEHIVLSENIVLFWQGSLPETDRQILKTDLADLTTRIERELLND